MIPSPPSSPRRGVTLATVLSLAFTSALLLCGAGNAPVKNLLPQGAMQGDLNAGGHALTNVASICTTNLISATGLTSTTTPPLWAYFGFALNKTGVSLGLSKDGHNFNVVPGVPYFPPDGGNTRDINLLTDYTGRPLKYNGLYYIVYTAAGFGGLPYFGIASTPDFLTWTFVKNVPVTGSGITTVTTTGTASSGSTTLTVTSGAGITVGMKVGQSAANSGISGLVTVSAISGTTVTLSAATTATVSGTVYFSTVQNDWSPVANIDATGTLRVFFRISTSIGDNLGAPGVGYMTCSDPGTFNTWSAYTHADGTDPALNMGSILHVGNTYYLFGNLGGATSSHQDLYYYSQVGSVTGTWTPVGFLDAGGFSTFFGNSVESAQMIQTSPTSYRCYMANQVTGNVYWSESPTLSGTSWTNPVPINFPDGIGLGAGCPVAFQNTDDQVPLLQAAVGPPLFTHFRNTDDVASSSANEWTTSAGTLELGLDLDGTGVRSNAQIDIGGGQILIDTPVVHVSNDFYVDGGGIYGNGLGLTNLNAANLFGTVVDSRLSANVPLLNAPNAFTAAQSVTTSGLGYPNASFTVTGNGSLTILRLANSASSAAQVGISWSTGGTDRWSEGLNSTVNPLDWFLYNGASGHVVLDLLTTDEADFYSDVKSLNGNVVVASSGKGIQIKEGSNAKQGLATLSGGTVTVANTNVTANSRFALTPIGSTINAVGISAVTAGTSFTIKSASSSDSNVVDYVIFEPAP